MRPTFFSALCGFLAALSAAQANDWYVSQNGTGQVTGYSATNAQSLGWLNNGSTWNPVSGYISSGDTVHLVGVITNTVGLFGNNVTLVFEPGASISPAAAQCIYSQGNANITIDGRGTGVIENTANGTGQQFQMVSEGIMASGCSNLTVQNLIIRNLYVKTNISDASIDGSLGGGVYANGMQGTVTVTGCTFSNVPWCVNLQGPQSFVNVLSNTFVNYDHGVGMGVSGNVSAIIASNIFGSTAAWDTGAADAYHHDGIHYFGTPTTASLVICHNLFNGNWGQNNTAHIYLETGPPNVLMYNNVFAQFPGDYLGNGMVAAYGNSNLIYNNTFLGSGVDNSTALTTGGVGSAVVNNVFVEVTTFVNCRASGLTFGNNLYGNQTPGGNSPWQFNGTSYNTLATWQGAVGDAQSVSTSSAQLNPDGSLITNGTVSPAVGMGTNLSSVFRLDFRSLLRGTNWDAGAFAAHGTIAPIFLPPVQGVHLVGPVGPVVEVTNYMVGSVSPGSLRNDATVLAGRAFTAKANITVIQLGRWVVAGNTQSHVISLFDHGCNLLGSTTVNTSGATPGQFVYAPLSSPVSLTAGNTYLILSSEVAGQDQWYDNNTGITLATNDTAVACAEYQANGTCTPSSGGNLSFGPVDAQYTKP